MLKIKSNGISNSIKFPEKEIPGFKTNLHFKLALIFLQISLIYLYVQPISQLKIY